MAATLVLVSGKQAQLWDWSIQCENQRKVGGALCSSKSFPSDIAFSLTLATMNGLSIPILLFQKYYINDTIQHVTIRIYFFYAK